MSVGAISGDMSGAGIGAAGAAGMVGIAGAAGVGATDLGSAAGVGAAQATAGMSATVTMQLQQLMQMLNDFSSAEILMAMMMMRGSDKDKKCQSGSDAAMGMLAGLALAGQMQQMSQFDFSSIQMTGGPTPDGGIGFQINFQA